MLAAVCGDTMIWKPSHKTPLTAIAVHQDRAARARAPTASPAMFNLVIGADAARSARRWSPIARLPLISATGSTAHGPRVGKVVAERFGRTLLELGGNNAIIVMDDADLDLALRAVLFGAVGTAGQRCTTTRRLILQQGIAAEMTRRAGEGLRPGAASATRPSRDADGPADRRRRRSRT